MTMVPSLRSPALQHDNIAGGPAGKQSRISFAAMVWSLCGRRFRSRRLASACASATVKVRGGAGDLLKVVLLQVSPAPGGGSLRELFCNS